MLEGLSFDPVTGRLCDYSADDRVDSASHVWAQTHSYLNRLDPVERRILRWLFGLDEETLSAEEIADRMNLSTAQVWRAVDRGLAEIGLYMLSESTLVIEEAA